MKLLVGVFLTSALVFLGIPANSFADFPVTNEKSYRDAEIAHDLQLAYAYWGKKPLCVETFMADVPGYWAWASGCSIWLDRTSWPARSTTDRCETIVHEVGHLLGHPHSDDPTNIMFPGSDQRSVPQCQPGYVLVKPKRTIKKCRHKGVIRGTDRQGRTEGSRKCCKRKGRRGERCRSDRRRG